MKMTSYNPSQLAKQRGVVAIEMALIITIFFTVFSFSYQLGRQLYWQQHFNYANDRFAKLLVLDILKTRKLNTASFDEALSLLENKIEHNDFEIGLRINILSDIRSDEQSFDIGRGCNKQAKYPDQMEQLPFVSAVKLKIIPPRYLLGISLCAQPKNWQNLNTVINSDFFSLPLHSQSYYPINHLVFN
jgi:hypothetical protein